MFKVMMTLALLFSSSAFAYNQHWSDFGTACGPYQPWGTSLRCPNTSPHGGPIGMRCNRYDAGTKCFGAKYWDPKFICTNPNTGQDVRGSYVFNMYICE